MLSITSRSVSEQKHHPESTVVPLQPVRLM
jgi:hypothetical protein